MNCRCSDRRTEKEERNHANKEWANTAGDARRSGDDRTEGEGG